MTRITRIVAWFAVWTVVGLFFSTQLYLINANLYHRKVAWEAVVIGTLAEYYCWFLLTPLILFLSRRFPIERPHPMRAVLLQIVFGAGISFVLVVGYSAIAHSLGWTSEANATFEGKFRFFFSVKFHWDLLTYAVLIACTQAFTYYKRIQEREASLAQAQLQALKSQLHPHFLFNALHATLALIRKDPAAAEKMVIRLGELLRATLESSGSQEVPLRQEIRFLEQYLEIERTRFADRLSIDMDIDPRALDVQVPNMILQPLVENAVKHGISPRSAPGHILVRAACQNGDLQLEVTDDGVGLASGPVKEGIGLSNTRARMKQLYGDAQQFELVTPSTGGLSARLRIPVKP